MERFEVQLTERLEDLKQNSLYRTLADSRGIDFCSNDYLGLAGNSELQESFSKLLRNHSLGSTGSRLLRGESDAINNLETKLAKFSESESALFFATGYQANLALFSSLLKENAVVFSDERNHASIIDGIRLSGCEKYIWGHNDLKDLELLLRQKAKSDKLNFIVVESIYSMTGQLAPLKELTEICEKYDCYLIVDEAHATGLYGPGGSGRVSELTNVSKVCARIQTAGKAMGVSGAWIACSKILRDYLINKARPFIYSTAPGHYQVAAVLASLNYLQQHGSPLRASYLERLSKFQNALNEISSKHSCELIGLGSPISSIVVGENKKALSVMHNLSADGFDVRAIRPPTVPVGHALLRITLPGARTEQEVSRFLAKLDFALGALK